MVGVELHLVKGHELHDVSGCLLPLAVVESVVSVKRVHVSEVSRPNADDDDGEREVAVLDDEVYGLIHIVDFAVGEDQQHLVAVGSLLMGLVGKVDELRDYGREVGRTR